MIHSSGDMVFVRYHPTVNGGLLPLEHSTLGIVINSEPATREPEFRHYVMHDGRLDWYHESWLTGIVPRTQVMDT